MKLLLTKIAIIIDKHIICAAIEIIDKTENGRQATNDGVESKIIYALAVC